MKGDFAKCILANKELADNNMDLRARIAELELSAQQSAHALRIAYDDGMLGGSPLKASTLALLKSLMER